jgi:hypothetical protein
VLDVRCTCKSAVSQGGRCKKESERGVDVSQQPQQSN